MNLKYLSKSLIKTLYKNLNFNSTSYNFRTLMYHSIVKDNLEYINRNIWKLNYNLFKDHIYFLKKNYSIYKTDFLIKKIPLDGICITFDDAFEDCYSLAAPFLFELNVPFSIFVVSNFIKDKKNGYINKKMLIELSNNKLVTVGSHSKNHYNLSKCNLETINNEVLGSKKFLEDIIGKEVKIFSYPHGSYNKKVTDIVMNANYKLAFTSNFKYNSQNDNKFLLNRNEIWNTDNLETLKEKLNGDWDWLIYKKMLKN